MTRLSLKSLANLLTRLNKKIAILLNCLLVSIISISGQCPDQNFLWKRVGDLNASAIPPQKKLTELLNFLNEIKTCPYKNDSTHIWLLSTIATVYSEQGDYLKEIQYRQEAIDIISANVNKPSIKIRVLPGRYYWQSVAYDSLNNATERRRALDSCISTSMRLKYVDRSTLTAFESRVENFFDVGDYQRCIDYSEMWESLGRKYANDNTGLERVAGESSVYSSIGWRVKALLELRNFQAAEDLLKDKLEEYRKTGLKNYVAMIYGLMAGVQEQKGEYGMALSYFNLSLKYYQGIKDYFNCKQVTKDIGSLYFRRLGDPEKALVFFKKALTYINNNELYKLRDAAESLDIFSNIADIYSGKGLYDSAHDYFQLAFDQIKRGVNETSILNSSSEEISKVKKVHYLTKLIIDKGNAYRQEFESTKDPGALREAIRIYKVADQFLNKIKAEQVDVQSKLFWRSDSRRLYENAIEAGYLQQNPVDAFYFFEKSRAVLLQDQLNEQHWTGQDNILRKAQVEKKIQQLEREMSSSDKTSADYSDLENEIFDSRQELTQLGELIKANAPLYYQSFVDTTSISVGDVQKSILKDHRALVELFSGDSAVYILVMTQQKASLQRVNKTDFDRLSEAYRNLLSKADFLNRNFETFKNLSLQLYQLLFQNINLPAGRIIISPDGKNFPFEALITNANPLTYFLDDHAVSYTYSARYLLNQFTTNTVSGSTEFMGIAPVHYANGFPALLGSDRSLQQVQGYFNNPVGLTGSNASKNNFLNQYFKYKVIQLYTHATDSGYSGEPTIYFSDSAMLLSDLFYETKPITSLIVLSACETAGGKLYNGEGVFSFNRQFAALGIPSSVSNLWEADDQSTYKITELFYKYLSKGMALDEALQRAKKEFKKTSTGEKELPSYWAAAILVGKTDPIPSQKHFPWSVVAGLSILTLLLFWVWGNKSTHFKKKF